MPRLGKAVDRLRKAIDKNDLGDVESILKSEGNNAKDACLCELSSGGNALHYAASAGHVDILAAILDVGVDVNCRRQDGDAAKGSTALHEAVNELQTEAVQFLIKKGAGVNLKDINGTTAMHIACREGSMELVQELVDSGADVNAIGNRGYSPLLVCIMRSAHDCSFFLLENGAEVKMVDKEGSSPLHYASEWESIQLVEALVARGADVNLQDSDGNTSLHVTGDDDVFDFLVRHGADPTIRNNKGKAARDQRIDMESKEHVKLNQALEGHTQRTDQQRKSHSARLQHAPPSRIFSPGPPLPETELRTARTNMLKEMQKRSGFEGAALTIPGQSKTTPRTPRSTAPALVSPLAKEAVAKLNSQLSQTSISTAK